MNTRSKKILSLLNLPKYETTKGLPPEQRQLAIDEKPRICLLENECTAEETEDKTSGSEFIPSTDYNDNASSADSSYNTKIKFGEEPENCHGKKKKLDNTNQKKIRILQNVILNETVNLKTAKIVETKADKCFIVEKYFQSINPENEEMCNVLKSYKEGARLETSEPELNENFELGKKKSPQSSHETMQEHQVEKRVSQVSNTTDTTKTSHDSFDKIFRGQNLENVVQIQPASKRNGKRVRDKKHVCYFCSKLLIHMGRHFETAHASELEIQKCLAHLPKSKERRQGFLEIIRVGDFYHNCTVLSTKQGELVLIRRPTQNEAKFVNYYDYGPCPNCLGFLLKKHIWHHLKYSCKEKATVTEEQRAKHVIAESNAIIADIHGFGFTREYNNGIISAFRSDEIGEICRTDNLIMKFGAMQFEKYGDTQNELIRQNMRQLARLTISLRKLSNKLSCYLNDFLNPDKFDLIVQTVKHISMNEVPSENFSRPDYHTPSLALKVGYSLKKCICIERGSALRSGNLKRNRALLSFLHLMKMEWEVRVSSNALSTLYRRKINAAQLLPITNDLVKLSNYLDNHINLAKTELIKNRNNFSWTRLATLTLARIILFNKRRSGEAAKMKMSNYIDRASWQDQNTHELKESLTPFEKKLAESLTVVEIEGKRGRKVPVILTPPVKESVDLLIRHRDECKIYFRNKYIFARSNQSLTHLRGHDCLNKICDEVSLENPALVTGTKLRKYVATVCQVFNMTENQYDWLARHLGHDIRVHRDFYRMHESAIELTKVSRLLLAVDKGEVNKFAGKTIEDIQLQDLPNLDYEEEQDDADKEEDDDKIDKEGEIEKGESMRKSEDDNPKNRIRNKKKIKGNHKNIHVPWSLEEKKAVIKFFQIKIKKGIVPGKAECETCIKENSELSNRDWRKIKFYVKNEISKIRKIKK